MNRSRELSIIRRARSELENHLIDEFVAGRITRREFLRRGSVLGMSLALLGTLSGTSLAPAARAATAPGNFTIRAAMVTPTGAIDPVTIADTGGITVLCQAAEYLLVSTGDLSLRPVLAESWKPNADGSVWTFKLREGVKFHNGKTMSADDVVASIDRLADPANGSNALSVFKGLLGKGATKKVDETTVEFHLDAPNGNFPYLISSDNYNAVILPAGYEGHYEKSFPGTGPFRIEKYTPKVGASFVRNPDYWGSKVLPARVELKFFDDLQPRVLALQGGQVDLIGQVYVGGARSLFNNPKIKFIDLKSSAHRELHMRNDKEPFTDKRVRRAVALCLNRPEIIQGLLLGKASLGNDSPFAPVFPSTNTSVAQRTKNLKEARQLLEAAGKAKGFTVQLTTQRYQEIPNYAVLVQNALKEIGVKIDIKLETSSAYYGKAVYGQSDWLDSAMGITDYGHRGVPNVFLAAPLESDGTWNAAHFKNPHYDALVKQYVKTVDLQSQRDVAGKIERLLLDETPIVYAYFFDWLTPTLKNLSGVEPTATGHLFLQNASFT